MTKSIASNIWKMYFFQVLTWFLIAMPIMVLFYQENGLSMKEVLILQAIFSLIIVFMEIPSGYFADIIGRKKSLILGALCGFIGFLIYAVSFNFWGFLIGEIIIGIGASFISGADSAMLYDTLLQLKKEKQYKKVEGRFLAAGNFSEGLAAILGGFLAAISLRTPIFAETAVLFLAIPIAFTLMEPKRHTFKASVFENVKNMARIIKFSLHDHPQVKWLIIYSAIIGSSTLTLVWFIQPYLQLVGLPIVLFGIVWAIFQFSVGYFSLIAHKVEAFFGRKTSLISLILLSFLGYFFLSMFQALWAMIFIFIFYFVRGLHHPIIRDYINTLITSDKRATVLSIRQLLARFSFAVIGPFIGFFHDTFSLSKALLIAGITFFSLGAVALFFLHKHRAL